MSSTNDHRQTIPAFTPLGAHDTATPATATIITRPADADGGKLVRLLAIQPEDQSIRLTLDGTTPVAGSVGFVVSAGERRQIPIANNTIVTIIEEAASPAATVQLQWGY